MDNETRVGGNEGSPDDEAEPELGDGVDVPEPPDEEVLHQLISDELGESIAELMRQMRRAQEAWRRRSNPGEGLRERKRRLTRQLISDAATLLFAIHGFDNVKVAEVADRVGVSEKTIYNVFSDQGVAGPRGRRRGRSSASRPRCASAAPTSP